MANATVGKPKHLKLIRKSRGDFMQVIEALNAQSIGLDELETLIDELPNNRLKTDIVKTLLSLRRSHGKAALAAGYGLGTVNDMDALVKRSPEG